MKFSSTHEWVLVEQEQALVGISSYAQKELGEIVYIKLPRLGQKVHAGEEIAILESTKAAVDIYSPVSGIVTQVNDKLKEDLSSLNLSPEKEGWLYKIVLMDPSELENLYDPQEYVDLMI